MAKSAVSMTPTRDDFMSLLEESYSDRPVAEGQVVKGKVLAIENDLVIIDVGLKTEGRVALKEFAMPGKDAEIKAGDTVEVFRRDMHSIQVSKHFWQVSAALALNMTADQHTFRVLTNPLDITIQHCSVLGTTGTKQCKLTALCHNAL